MAPPKTNAKTIELVVKELMVAPNNAIEARTNFLRVERTNSVPGENFVRFKSLEILAKLTGGNLADRN
jgi:hypothetical protein